MLNGCFSEDLFLDFQTALKRVPKNMQCQHCYTTAYGFMDKDPQNAIRLIKYGIDTYDSDWIDQMRAYQNLGYIYEVCKQYEDAKGSFQSALFAVPELQRESYIPNISMDILRTELHCSNFEYTEYAYDLYCSVTKADEFSASFRHYIFYRAVMELIIAKKNNDVDSQRRAHKTATQVLDGDNVTGMDMLLQRHRYKDEAKASKEAIAFLKQNEVW